MCALLNFDHYQMASCVERINSNKFLHNEQAPGACPSSTLLFFTPMNAGRQGCTKHGTMLTPLTHTIRATCLPSHLQRDTWSARLRPTDHLSSLKVSEAVKSRIPGAAKCDHSRSAMSLGESVVVRMSGGVSQCHSQAGPSSPSALHVVAGPCPLPTLGTVITET